MTVIPQKDWIGKRLKLTFTTWQSMIDRCDSAPYYRHKGIIVCERWRESFEDFLYDVRLRPSRSHTLDRIDNDGNYEPGNVRWATWKVQGANKRTTRWFTYEGETLHLKDWVERLGVVSYSTASSRISLGWSLEDALFTPATR